MQTVYWSLRNSIENSGRSAGRSNLRTYHFAFLESFSVNFDSSQLELRIAGIITSVDIELIAIVKIASKPNTETVRNLEKARTANPEIRVAAFTSNAWPAVLEALLESS
ncbi:hypothetical protein V511_09305 [Mesotoga sp. Brook.08.YT.4.2.5.1]|nr:hypothetical protein V511_09305 [Mesotoga sp. Brook.08.YT.4.2.5.1]PNS42721.1 hypothetical protein RJ60_00375 [Mesotoga sp. B105.6.4]RDI94437.1 hypothetical protein Q502_00390 [Mesotoga sp. Brook.08.YT.4.2.5.2.]